MRGKCRLGELVHAMDNSEYNSSPEPSLARVGEEESKEFLARPDPVTVEKVLAIQKKIFSTLDEIASRLDRIPLPNGDSDLSRRTRRVAEFSVRFSRYYLYDLGRRITDMRRHIHAVSPDARPKPSGRSSVFHLQAIGRKMIAAHQILLQALNAYCNHIPSSTAKGHRHKLRQVLQVLTDLRDMCNKINISAEYYESGDAVARPLVSLFSTYAARTVGRLPVFDSRYFLVTFRPRSFTGNAEAFFPSCSSKLWHPRTSRIR